ncbi:MAG: type II toxin-antitoxin system Phd/YefM family antitoxin [Candidatus Omnitrophica bacterium]|nr:type II toxin-antitoxin system Phd/YefM family antitoxin [Candidatus Omnitrophota bacterium]
MKTLANKVYRPNPKAWNLADAKNRFSEVVGLALQQGPQTVSRRNERVVIISERAFQKLTGVEHTFLDFIFKGPGLDGVDLTRDKALSRKISL